MRLGLSADISFNAGASKSRGNSDGQDVVHSNTLVQAGNIAMVQSGGTTLAAGNNINIEAAQNTQSSSSFYEKKESGLLDSGGAGITIGSREQSTDQKSRSTTAAASTVGSIAGNITLVAGEER